MPAGRTSVLAMALTALLLAQAACRPAAPPLHPVGAPGRWYVIEQGETLGDVARRAGVPEEDLLELNGLRSAAEAQPGRVIFVLDPTRPPGNAANQAARLGAAPEAATAAPAEASRFRWPVDSPRLTSLFGTRQGRPHEGIDLVAPVGTPVFAAGNGQVVYAGGAVRGYGNMIVVKHDGELMTVYAHNSVLMVKVGDRVLVGQRIALSGQSGHATGPHVHFEVRRGQVPHDPLPYLPDIRNARRERTPKS